MRDCALVMMATGIRAQNLREFLDGIQKAHGDSIYHHFWGRLLQPQFDEPEFNNDFASWARHGLHEKALAERLSVIDPTEYTDTEDLRAELMSVLEERLDETEFIPWAQADAQFYFLQSEIIVFDTGKKIETLPEFTDAIVKMTLGSIYYHFIDSRKRNLGHIDDFSYWLAGLDGTGDICRQISVIDPYFSSLNTLQRRLSALLAEATEKVGNEESA